MILVIADDLTGAAEIGGIAHRFGLSAEILTAPFENSPAEVVVIDSDSRSCPPDEAVRRLKHRLAFAYNANPEWIFKKTDSVLRGHPARECEWIAQTYGKTRCLFIPANPSVGRTIRAGQYLIHNQPIDQTDFARDPQYPARSASVVELLNADGPTAIHLANVNGTLPSTGLIVGQAETSTDMRHWASCVEPDTLAAGAADFFTACLQSRGFNPRPRKQPMPSPKRPSLWVFGSGSDYSHRVLQECKTSGVAVVPMPVCLFEQSTKDNQAIEVWSDQIAAQIEKHLQIIVAIDQPLHPDGNLALRLKARVGQVVQMTLAKTSMDHLLIEGGATAAAVVEQMGWNRLHLVREESPGVVTLAAGDKSYLLLTLKPGSYPWPEHLKQSLTQPNTIWFKKDIA